MSPLRTKCFQTQITVRNAVLRNKSPGSTQPSHPFVGIVAMSSLPVKAWT